VSCGVLSLLVASSHQASTLLVLILALPVTSLFVTQEQGKVADKPIASQEELCSMKLISWLIGFVKTV